MSSLLKLVAPRINFVAIFNGLGYGQLNDKYLRLSLLCNTLFTDDAVLLSQTRKLLNDKIELSRMLFESIGEIN